MDIKKIILFLGLIALNLSSLQAQSLKKYSGKFRLDNLDVEGTARYSYKDAPEGTSGQTRLFHGDFYFESKEQCMNSEDRIVMWVEDWEKSYEKYYSRLTLSGDNGNLPRTKSEEILYGFPYINKRKVQITVKGQFANNKQVGEWTWTFYDITSGKKLSEIILTFNQDGVIEGPASYHAYDMEDHYKCRFINGQLSPDPIPYVNEYCGRSKLTATLQNGHLVGKYEYVKYENKHISQNYNSDQTRVTVAITTSGQFDDDGNPIGVWTRDNVTAKFDDNGRLLESYYIDDSTGDKISAHIPITKVEINPWLYNNRSLFLMRDSKLGKRKSDSLEDVIEVKIFQRRGAID